MTDELRTAYIQALIDRVRFIYVNAPSLDDALITTPYWDELQDLQGRIERLIFEQTPITKSTCSKTFNAVHKRSNGEGSIYQRKDSRWVASVMRAGRRISRYTRSEDEAQEALEEMHAEHSRAFSESDDVHFEHEGPPLTGPDSEPDSASPPAAPSEAGVQEAAATARGGTSDRGEGFPSGDGVTEPPAVSPDEDEPGIFAEYSAPHLTNEAETDALLDTASLSSNGCICPGWWRKAAVYFAADPSQSGEHHHEGCPLFVKAANHEDVQEVNNAEEELLQPAALPEQPLATAIPPAPSPKHTCIEGCGMRVSGPGKRCRRCSAAVRWGTRTKSDGQRNDTPASRFVLRPRSEPEPAPEPETLPECACPPLWWSNAIAREENARKPSDKHNHLCPLHRHRWVLASTATDGVYPSRCACGAEREHRPYEAEDAWLAKAAGSTKQEAQT